MRRWRIALVNVIYQTALPNATPPMGILYLAAHLRANNDVDIRVWDQGSHRSAPEDLVSEIIAFEPDLVGFSSLTPSAFLLGPMIQGLRQALPRVRIVVGGAHASAFGADALTGTGADAVVAGEGELSFEAIVRAYQDGGGLDSIPGLIWCSPDGDAVTNPGTPPIVDDLDTLPFPAYDLIDVRAYWPLWSFCVIPPPRRYISLFSSRGCPYKCIYCHQIFGKRFRANSPERIVEETEYYVRQFGVDEIEFLDDIFNLNPRRVFQVADLMGQRNLKLKVAFPNGLRTDVLTEDIVEALGSMGTHLSALALESGSPRIQKFIGKRLNISRYLKGVELMTRRGIFTTGFVMLGFPTETEAEMRETIAVAYKSALHHAWFWRVTPYPNTALYDLVQKTQPEKFTGIDYADTDYGYRPATNLSEVSDEVLLALVSKAYARFYLNPRRMYRLVRDFPRRSALIGYVPRVLASFTRRSLPNRPTHT